MLIPTKMVGIKGFVSEKRDASTRRKTPYNGAFVTCVESYTQRKKARKTQNNAALKRKFPRVYAIGFMAKKYRG